MALLFVCLVLQLLFLCPTINAAENDSELCIRGYYDELKRALLDNKTNNTATLLKSFYPPNKQDIQVARIKYCIGDNKTLCSDKQFDEVHTNFTFKWAASALLLVQEYELINALVFNLFQFNYTNITLIINQPFCDFKDDSENDTQAPDTIDNLRLLTTWLKPFAQSNDNNENGLQQDFAVHLDEKDKEKTFDITVYGRVENLHNSLLGLQFAIVFIIILTLLLRIFWNNFANEIDMKVNEVSKSLSRISNFIKGIKKDMDKCKRNQTKTSQKKSWEYTASYIILLVGFIIWDSVQYCKAKKISKYEWILFFPMPCVAPTIIIGFFILFVCYLILKCLKSGFCQSSCRQRRRCCCHCSKSCRKRNDENNMVIELNESASTTTSEPASETTPLIQGSKTKSSETISSETTTPNCSIEMGTDTRSTDTNNEENSNCHIHVCTCTSIRDIVHFPLLTGLGVFFVYHGSWMLLMFGAYANVVIIRSLFLFPLFIIIIALLPRSIKGFCNVYIDWHYKCYCCLKLESCIKKLYKCIKICKCNQRNEENKELEECVKCKECNKCTTCKNCNTHSECKKCMKCDTCKKRNPCLPQNEKCSKCQKCKYGQCRRCSCIHCKQCTLCEDCKNCSNCTQCCSCNLSNLFKLCIDCMEKKQQERNKDIIAIYGFSVTLAIAIPLLFVLYYGSEYILVVTDIYNDPFKLFIALIVMLAVTYYLIIIWDSDTDGKDNNQQSPADNIVQTGDLLILTRDENETK